MTDDNELEEEEGCPGEDDCDDPYCDERDDYEVEYTFTVKGTVRAHSKDEAESLASDMQGQMNVEFPRSHPDEWDDLNEVESEFWVESVQERAANEYRWRQEMAKAVEESTSEPT